MTRLGLLLIAVVLMAGSAQAQLTAPGTQIRRPSTLTALPDISVTGSAGLLRAADASRFELSCTVGSAANIRVGGSDVSATKGQSILAKASFKTTVTDAVYAVSEGASVTVSCAEETQ